MFWFFGYAGIEFILPKLVHCLDHCICGCGAPHVKVGSTLSGFLDMRKLSSSCQSWYFFWVFGYEDADLILLCCYVVSEFWIRRCRAHPAKVGTLSGFLDTRMKSSSCRSSYIVRVLDTKMQSSSCQSWYFVWVFGYENEELIMSEFVHCQGVWILRCRAHPAKVGTLFGFLYMRMQTTSCQSWCFFWVFRYEEAERILPKLVLCLVFWI